MRELYVDSTGISFLFLFFFYTYWTTHCPIFHDPASNVCHKNSVFYWENVIYFPFLISMYCFATFTTDKSGNGLSSKCLSDSDSDSDF